VTLASSDHLGRNMSSRRWLASGGLLLGSFLASLTAGAIVRHELAIGQGFWVVAPELFVRHDQNLNLPLGLVGLGTVALAILLGGAVVAIARAAPERPGLLLAVTGIGVGALLADAAEAVTRGSVTDFLGIRASGVFSAGDIAYLAGGALLPIAMDRAIRTWFSNLGRAAVAFGAVAGIEVAALRIGHEPLSVVVAIGAIASAGIVLMGERLAGRHHVRSQVGTQPPLDR